jgi:hypothetical protein
MVIGNGLTASGLVTAPVFRVAIWQGQAMSRQLQPWQSQVWRSGVGERLWLSMLIDAMEEVGRPQFRSQPCEPSILIALRAQLARPASPYAHCASRFGLRN